MIKYNNGVQYLDTTNNCGLTQDQQKIKYMRKSIITDFKQPKFYWFYLQYLKNGSSILQ